MFPSTFFQIPKDIFEEMHKDIADIAQIVKPDLNIVDAGSKVILSTDILTAEVSAR